MGGFCFLGWIRRTPFADYFFSSTAMTSKGLSLKLSGRSSNASRQHVASFGVDIRRRAVRIRELEVAIGQEDGDQFRMVHHGFLAR